MKLYKLIFPCLIFAIAIVKVNAQNDLISMLDQDTASRIDYTNATFKATRIVIGTSCENPPKGNALFLITHHFGALNSGYQNLYGLKQATIRIGGEYGLSDRIGFGVGLNTFENTWDGFIKVKALRQCTGAKNMPITMTIFGSTAIYSTKWSDPYRQNYFVSRMSYALQVIIARKFTPSLSLQFMPTYVHKNLVATPDDHNNIFSIGAGGRMKISKRVSVNAEYYYLLPGQIYSQPDYSAFSLGVDIETGGHVFQIFLTNSMGENMESIITETQGNWLDGDIFLGFNISRVFTIVKPEEFK